MTGHIYRDVTLEQHVSLFRGVMGAEFLLMDDNARPHRANIVDECLQSEDITRMDWPAYSPDLNPIEHVASQNVRRAPLGGVAIIPMEHEHIKKSKKGCGSPVVKVLAHGRHVMSSSPIPLRVRRVGERCTLHLSRTQTSSSWCDSGGANSGVVLVT
ncbi:DDE_3 domain-containing protein [Trichonephila clavipes]|nr:DDE_3 domain-containing protein [Trichonephila clavipes]